MKCKQCGTEYESKRSTSKYCSAKCRKLAFQPNGKVSVPELSVPEDTVEGEQPTRTSSLEHYQANPDKYIKRAEPDKLNWGPWMSSDELSKAGLKANRTAKPGDWDYEDVPLYNFTAPGKMGPSGVHLKPSQGAV